MKNFPFSDILDFTYVNESSINTFQYFFLENAEKYEEEKPLALRECPPVSAQLRLCKANNLIV